jgi:hypothetical protein
MKRRGHGGDVIRKLVYDNPLRFFRQARRWQEWAMESRELSVTASAGNGAKSLAAASPRAAM